jgi:hypothetical protein
MREEERNRWYPRTIMAVESHIAPVVLSPTPARWILVSDSEPDSARNRDKENFKTVAFLAKWVAGARYRASVFTLSRHKP